MDHGTHAGTGSTGVDITALVIRLVLLLSTTSVAGAGLLRPLAGELPRRLTVLITALGGLSAVLAVVSISTVDVSVAAAVIHALLALVIPAILRWPSAARWTSAALILLVVVETALGRSGLEFAVDTVYVTGAAVWFGVTLLSLGVPSERWRTTTSLRLGPLAVTLGGLLALAGVVRLGLSGVGFDRRLYATVFGASLLTVIVLPVVVTVLVGFLPRGAEPGRAYRLGVAGIAIGFLGWSSLAAIPQPPALPTPGVPLLASASVAGKDVPVLVSPQRPGRNLVHFPASAGDALAVGVEGGLVSQASALPGAEGTWVEVDLPRGRSDLVVRKGDAQTTVEVDAGEQAGPVRATGADGAECASAALGGLVNGRRDVLSACPADALSAADADALHKLVGFLAGRQTGGITLVQDDSPRGIEAAKVVRESAAQKGLRVDTEPGQNNALVVVAGWAGGYTAMTRAAEAQRAAPAYLYGVYVAPWLLNAPIVNTVASSSVPLRFDPREQLAVSFAVALGNAFGDESPTVGGYAQWLGTQQRTVDGEVQMYASAQVNAMPMYPSEPHAAGMTMSRNYPGQWIPEGTVVPVSVPLR
jgi:hypothetical protein